jgi:hypothetical protein
LPSIEQNSQINKLPLMPTSPRRQKVLHHRKVVDIIQDKQPAFLLSQLLFKRGYGCALVLGIVAGDL